MTKPTPNRPSGMLGLTIVLAAMMIVFGALTILALMSGYVFPQIRNMEILLPDHDQLEKISEKEPAMGAT